MLRLRVPVAWQLRRAALHPRIQPRAPVDEQEVGADGVRPGSHGVGQRRRPRFGRLPDKAVHQVEVDDKPLATQQSHRPGQKAGVMPPLRGSQQVIVRRLIADADPAEAVAPQDAQKGDGGRLVGEEFRVQLQRAQRRRAQIAAVAQVGQEPLQRVGWNEAGRAAAEVKVGKVECGVAGVVVKLDGHALQVVGNGRPPPRTDGHQVVAAKVAHAGAERDV